MIVKHHRILKDRLFEPCSAFVIEDQLFKGLALEFGVRIDPSGKVGIIAFMVFVVVEG